MNTNLLTSFRQALSLAAQIWVLEGGPASEGHDNPYEGDRALSLVSTKSWFYLFDNGSGEQLRRTFVVGVEAHDCCSCCDRWDVASGKGETEEQAIRELLHNLQFRIDREQERLKGGLTPDESWLPKLGDVAA